MSEVSVTSTRTVSELSLTVNAEVLDKNSLREAM